MPEIASAKLSINPERLPSGPSALVLDVGCGDGRHLLAAARRGCRAVGLESDPSALREARTLLRGHAAGLVLADATRLPFRDGAFMTVVCTETLEHLADDSGAMREIARVLRANGELLGAVPSHFTELVYFVLSRGYRSAPGGHVRIYAPRRLLVKLAESGLRVTSTRYLHFTDSLAWLRFCIADAARPARSRSDFEAAVLLAVAEARTVPRWRAHLRAAVARSWFIGVVDRVGALVWPKSFAFEAVKLEGRGEGESGDARR